MKSYLYSALILSDIDCQPSNVAFLNGPMPVLCNVKERCICPAPALPSNLIASTVAATRCQGGSMSDQTSNDNNASLDRRDFLKTVTVTGATLGAASQAFAAKSLGKMSNRVIGANDRINIGVIGCGGRGSSDANSFAA